VDEDGRISLEKFKKILDYTSNNDEEDLDPMAIATAA